MAVIIPRELLESQVLARGTQSSSLWRFQSLLARRRGRVSQVWTEKPGRLQERNETDSSCFSTPAPSSRS